MEKEHRKDRSCKQVSGQQRAHGTTQRVHGNTQRAHGTTQRVQLKEHRTTQKAQQSRNRVRGVRVARATRAARYARVRKIILLRRMAVATILIGLGIAGIFLLMNSQSRGIEKASKTAIEKAVRTDTENVAASSEESTLVVESQEGAADDATILHDTPDTEAVAYPFNQMSADWSDEDLKGWRRYTIPSDFERTGGYLPDIVQVYTYSLCKQNNIRYSLVLAVMEIESGYQYDALSGTNDIGYMQVNYKWQQDKMPDMTEKALYNPYVNIKVGIEYLVELSEEFTTEEAVLTAYHYGVSGAYSRCSKDAEITSDYADRVLAASARIEKELKAREEAVKGGYADAALD